MSSFPKIPRFRITSPLLSGTVTAFVWLCIGAVVASLIVVMTDIREETVSLAAFLIHGIASVFGGFSSGRRAGSKGWYHGFVLGIVYTLIVVLVGFLGFDAGMGRDTAILLSIAAFAGTFGGMIGVNAK